MKEGLGFICNEVAGDDMLKNMLNNSSRIGIAVL